MYLLIIATLMAVVGGANVLFAFVQPPAAIEPMFDGFSRRIRFIVSFLPERRQVMGGAPADRVGAARRRRVRRIGLGVALKHISETKRVL